MKLILGWAGKGVVAADTGVVGTVVAKVVAKVLAGKVMVVLAGKAAREAKEAKEAIQIGCAPTLRKNSFSTSGFVMFFFLWGREQRV